MGNECLVEFGFCISRNVDLGLFMTIVLFLAGLAINSKIDRSKKFEEARRIEDQRREARRSYLRALGEEIKLNVASLQSNTNATPSVSDIYEFMALSKDNTPHMTFSYLSVIYINRTEVLQDLPAVLVKNIVEFYGILHDVSVDIEGMEKKSFLNISKKGREEVLYSLFSNLSVAIRQGKSIVDFIERELQPDR